MMSSFLQPAIAATATQEFFSVAITIRNRWGEGNVFLGIPLAQIEMVERLSLSLICLIPHMPPAFRGVRQQRGSLIWVIDLGVLLGLPVVKGQFSQSQPALMLTSGSHRVTCLVSHLQGIVAQGSRVLRPVPQLVLSQRRLIQGILPDPQNPLAILNLEALWATLKGQANFPETR